MTTSSPPRSEIAETAQGPATRAGVPVGLARADRLAYVVGLVLLSVHLHPTAVSARTHGREAERSAR